MFITNITIDRLEPQQNFITSDYLRYEPNIDNAMDNMSVVKFHSGYKIIFTAYLENEDMPYINSNGLIGQHVSLKSITKHKLVPNLMPNKEGIDKIPNPEPKQIKKSSINYVKLED